MAKKKHRHERGPTPPNTGKTGGFRLVVAANPGSSVTTVAPELDLLKAALLYGDKVTVLSPVTTMFLRVEGLQRFSPLEQIELMRRVAPILMPAEEVPAFQAGIEEVDDFLHSTARGGSGGQRLLRAGLLQRFAPVQEMLSESVTASTVRGRR